MSLTLIDRGEPWEGLVVLALLLAPLVGQLAAQLIRLARKEIRS